jgi:hypothetical protein
MAPASGKKRANCAGQSVSCSLTTTWLECFTQPLDYSAYGRTMFAAPHTRSAASESVPAMRNARRTPKQVCIVGR